jgi:hypothetical protein
MEIRVEDYDVGILLAEFDEGFAEHVSGRDAS